MRPSPRPLVALGCLLLVALVGCRPEQPWELVDSEYDGPLDIHDVRWQVVDEPGGARLAWDFDVVNDGDYVWSGERGVGVEVSAYDAQGQLVARGITSKKSIDGGRHSYAGQAPLQGGVAVVKLRFVDA